MPGVESARSLARGSVGHNTRATQVRGILAANTRATEQSQDGETGNRPDARALIPVVQYDFPPSDRSHRRAGDAVLPAGRRIRAGVAALPVSRSAPGLPTVITPEVRTIGGIAGTRRRAAWQPLTGQDPVGTGRHRRAHGILPGRLHPGHRARPHRRRRHARMAVSRPSCSPERMRPAGFSAAPAPLQRCS